VTAGPYALEHGSTRFGRWLRARRLWIALWLAALEGVLVVADVIPGWLAVVVAVVVIGVYLVAGRAARYDTLKQASWIAAASQVAVVLVPVLVAVATALAVVAVAVIAVVAVIALLADRR
jgi:hypothetical protein